MERFQALLSALNARVLGDVRVRTGVLAVVGGLAPALAIAVLGDASSAYAVARVSLPELAPPSALAGLHADESHTAHGMGGGEQRLEPREFLRAAPSEHVETISAHVAPYPVTLPGESHGDSVLELRPAEDPAVEPRLAGVEDLGAASHAAAAAPTLTSSSHDAHGGGAAHDDAPITGGLEPASAGEHAAAPHVDHSESLAPAPIEALARSGPGGLLPRIAPNGETPAHAYARPFEANDDEPLIAVVIGGLGLNAAATAEAIDMLPPEVTLSFVPYSEDLQDWINDARAAGHEVILEVPMEPYDYPANDPGPHTLLARADPVENQRRLEWLMSRAAGYFAVMNYLGARFTAQPDALVPVFETIAESGVAFLYDGETERTELKSQAHAARLAAATADRIIDAQPRASAIDEQLLHLEALAIQNGDALGAGFGYPVTVRQVEAWADTLDLKGYRLAPVSAVLARRAAHTSEQLAHVETAAPATMPSFSRVSASFGGGEEEEDGGDGHGESDGGSEGGGGH